MDSLALARMSRHHPSEVSGFTRPRRIHVAKLRPQSGRAAHQRKHCCITICSPPPRFARVGQESVEGASRVRDLADDVESGTACGPLASSASKSPVCSRSRLGRE
jgi:hypothetical protein